LTINCPLTNGKDVNYSIFTLSGGKIAEATLTTDIDISKLSRGKYFIEVSQGNERYRQSFVKE
jgi:hypothetical protein